jgi:hypothetical protein
MKKRVGPRKRSPPRRKLKLARIRKRAPRPGEGRPTLYKDEYAKEALKLCLLGATDAELADFFEVSIVTLNVWKAKHPEFVKALKTGKEPADDRVKRSLYLKATGYSHPAVKIFLSKNGEPVIVPYIEHVPPSDTAMIFWLKNRCKDEFRADPTGEGGSGTLTIKVEGGLPKEDPQGVKKPED